jgi:hypothetical protein
MASTTAQTPAVTRGWDRNAPLTGACAVVLWVIGVILFSTAAGKSKGPDILAQYKDNSNQILLGALIWMIGIALFVWFLGSLRDRLLVAEGGLGRLTSIAYAGGILTAAMGALWPSPDIAGALGKDDIDASAAGAMHHLGDGFFVAAEYMAPVLLTATAIIALRSGILPRWFAWLTVLVALVLLIGPIGWAALIFGFPIWTLILSFFVWRSSVVGTAAGRPITATADV